jgi:hypothetical protein
MTGPAVARPGPRGAGSVRGTVDAADGPTTGGPRTAPPRGAPGSGPARRRADRPAGGETIAAHHELPAGADPDGPRAAWHEEVAS